MPIGIKIILNANCNLKQLTCFIRYQSVSSKLLLLMCYINKNFISHLNIYSTIRCKEIKIELILLILE